MQVRLNSADIDALARTSMSEVGHFGRYGSDVLKGGVEAVVDTIINRVAHPQFPDTVPDVVDARNQFSAIGGTRGVGTWSRLRAASAAVEQIVQAHVDARFGGKACTVKGATHFLNPHFSSRSALHDWGAHVVRHAVAIWGRNIDIHYHGFAPDIRPAPEYALVADDGRTRKFSGVGVPLDQGVASAGEHLSEGAPTGPSDEKAAARAYRVETIAVADGQLLEATLNSLSASGWGLRQIIPAGEKLILVTEGVDHDLFDELDEGDPPAPAIGQGGTDPSDRYLSDFTQFLNDHGLDLQHFSPKEFLVLGGQNGFGPCAAKNKRPPQELWPNILATARVLAELRSRLNSAVVLSSVYRSPEYNACLPGSASGSLHMEFRAADFTCRDGNGSVYWATKLKEMRDEGVFRGGIGVYQTFVHVDTRGRNVQFGPWMSKVF